MTSTHKSIRASSSVPKTVKRYVRNAFNTFSSVAPLKQVLFSKQNRHEIKRVIPLAPKKNDDFSDARHYEHFARHSSHFSSKNFI